MIVKRILIVVAILFAAVVALWSAAIALVATPEFLTPRVTAIAQQSIKSDFSVKNIDLSLFESFPNVTLRIDSLRIAQTKDSIDDLLFARECRVAVNPVALLFKKVDINNVSLRDASIYVYVDSLHGPLKTFNLPEEQKQTTDTVGGFDMSEYSFDLRRLRVDSLNLIINDRTRDFYTRIEDYNLDMSMSLSPKISKADVVTSFDNLIVWHKGDLLVKKTAMSVDTRVVVDKDSLTMSFEKADVHLNGIDLKSSGKLRRDSITRSLWVDIDSSLTTPSLTEFLALIPTSVIDSKDKITTQGSVALDLKIEGEYAENILPTLSATLKVEDAKARYASRKLSLESVNCDAFMYLDLNAPKRSYADIKRLQVNTSKIINLDVSGRVTSFIDSPKVALAVKSYIDFDRFTEVFPLNEGIVCSGRNDSDLKVEFALSDLLNSDYSRLNIDGESIFRDLSLSFDASKFVQDTSSTAYLYMQAKEGKMLFGEKIRSDNGSRTLRANINFSGIGYKSKTGEYLTIRDIELAGGANFDRKTSAINGFGLRGIAKNMDVGLDSLFKANLESSDVLVTIVPKNETRKASASLKINSEHITASEPKFNSKMTLSTVDMDVTAHRNDKDETAKSKWTLSGNVGFSDLDMYTDLFPLNMSIPKTSVVVKGRTIYLTNAQLAIGESKMVATGYIKNLMHKLFVEPRETLSGELDIVASVLDINELMAASNESYMLIDGMDDAQSVGGVDSLSLQIADSTSLQVAETEPQQDSLVAPVVGDSTMVAQVPDSLSRGKKGARKVESNTIFLVPRRMNFIFDLHVKKALFESAAIENVEGRATIKKGILTLEKLSLEAIGAEATGSMTYKNIDSRSSNVAFNMGLEGVDINRIGELMPSISTMFPMLKSFEGSVDFDIKANTNLVDDAQIDVSTLASAMKFKGRNLVLMDSETFADLSKTLMFKNKKRNLIDSLEAYAIVKESKVDVLPFSMSIDRYTAIIGGSQVIDPQTFDVDYQYNVSIMKSPLPFKAGVDIKGNLTDFDFKVTKAILKNTDFVEQRRIYEQYRDSIE